MFNESSTPLEVFAIHIWGSYQIFIFDDEEKHLFLLRFDSREKKMPIEDAQNLFDQLLKATNSETLVKYSFIGEVRVPSIVKIEQIPDFLLFLLFEISVNEVDATVPVFQITKEEIEEFQNRVKWATL